MALGLPQLYLPREAVVMNSRNSIATRLQVSLIVWQPMYLARRAGTDLWLDFALPTAKGGICLSG